MTEPDGKDPPKVTHVQLVHDLVAQACILPSTADRAAVPILLLTAHTDDGARVQLALPVPHSQPYVERLSRQIAKAQRMALLAQLRVVRPSDSSP